MVTNWSEQVQKAAQGDKSACAELYKSTYRKTFFLADKILQNETEAQKMIEKSYSEAFSDLNKLGNPDLFESWIVNITARNCCNRIKENGFSAFREGDYTHTAEIDDKTEFLPSGLPSSEKAVAFVSKLVDSLPDYQRAAVVLSYCNNLPASGIAHMLSVSEENVKSMLFSAREKIKTETDARLPHATTLYSSDKTPVLGEVLFAVRKQKAVNPELFRESFRNIAENSVRTKPEIPAPVSSVPAAAPAKKPEVKKAPKKKSPVLKIVAIITAAAIVIAGVIGGGLGIAAWVNRDKGSADAPHLEAAPSGFVPLYTAEDLELIRSDLSANYIMMNDIDMSSVSDWEPIASEIQVLTDGFSGVFDGNGYTIKNLSSKGHSNAGLFAYVCDGTVMNLRMENVDIKGESSAGGVAANVFGVSGGCVANISNCHVVSGEIHSEDRSGGIAGIMMTFEGEDTNSSCVTKYCSNGASVSGHSSGGTYGTLAIGSYGTVIADNLMNYGEINGEFNSGGLFGVIENDEGEISIKNTVSIGKVNPHTSDNYNASTGLIAAEINADNDFSVELINCVYTIVEGLDPYKLANAVIKDESLGITEKEAQKKSTFEFLDFDSIWEWDSKKKMPVFKSFLANDDMGIISSTPDTSATESTTLLSEENLTAASSDFNLLFSFLEHFIRHADSYDCNSSGTYDKIIGILLNNPFTTGIYSVYFDNETYVSNSNDPLGKFGGEYYEYYIFPGEDIDWILTNVFNLTPDHSLNTDDRYYHNGSYYVGTYGAGDNYREFSLENKTQSSDGTYTLTVKCEITDMGDEEPSVTEYYTIKTALREDNGKKYWSLYSITLSNSESAETTASPSESWKTAYNEYLYSYYNEIMSEEYGSTSDMSFGFAYITDDDIPELLISEGTYMSAQVRLVTYVNNSICELGDFGFMGELPYVERGSVFVDGYYNRGIDTCTYYEMADDGSFKEIFSYYTNAAATEDESEIVYKINDIEVSREEFDASYDSYNPETISFENSDGYAFTTSNFDKYCW